ncbi:MAG TPA: hypothetical protein VGH28_03370 [Polyangiaceae bacterium]|jgi:hypothetical protein
MLGLLQLRSRDRVRKRGSKKIAARLDAELERRLERAADDPLWARKRLHHLDREWDIDRAILVPFAFMGAAALILARRGKRLYRVPLGAQIGAMVAYATIGWCPPAAILRRLGFRTRQEIEAERLGMIANLTH